MSWRTASAGSLLGSLLDPDDEGDTFPLIVGLPPSCIEDRTAHVCSSKCGNSIGSKDEPTYVRDDINDCSNYQVMSLLIPSDRLSSIIWHS